MINSQVGSDVTLVLRFTPHLNVFVELIFYPKKRQTNPAKNANKQQLKPIYCTDSHDVNSFVDYYPKKAP